MNTPPPIEPELSRLTAAIQKCWGDYERNLQSKMSDPPPFDPYNIDFHGHKLDPYRVLELFQITDPAIQQAVKKLLRCGKKHKDAATDVGDAITSLERWKDMRDEDEVFNSH